MTQGTGCSDSSCRLRSETTKSRSAGSCKSCRSFKNETLAIAGMDSFKSSRIFIVKQYPDYRFTVIFLPETIWFCGYFLSNKLP